ncbi:MAG: ABC transporter permease [Acidobacteria bacterium]|nr:ABC transporter permease [Acidobacteriota bacterium]MCI0620762.1 ABC transporter permease [Acidobacteriota bacterium]MCI0718941.1 ABC transporter permease [Acidobacteriota bacterium]
MNLRRTRAVARKEFRHILRDARSLALALALPMMMLLLFGYALSLDVDEIPTAVLDQDRTPQSRELLERFQASRYFKILDFPENLQAIERGMDRGEIVLGIVIPPDYSRQLVSGKRAEAQLLFDGSDSNTASIAVGYADGVVQTYALELREQFMSRRSGMEMPSVVEPRLRIWYNSELKSKNYIVPGLIAVILMIISAMLTSLTIAREWEMGTMEQVLSTPLRPAELVLGKMSAYFCLGLADALIAVLIGVFVFGVPLRGNLVLLFTSTCIFLFGALCWGILLSAIARSQLLAYQMGIISSFLPAFLLSGFIFSIENMPAVVQVVTHIVPARYFVTLLKGIFLKGIGVNLLWLELSFLLAYCTLVFVGATRKVGSKLA